MLEIEIFDVFMLKIILDSFCFFILLLCKIIFLWMLEVEFICILGWVILRLDKL